MKTLYTERDYTYGATMLTLRTAIGLTQEGLADNLGVSRRAVGKWEAGSVYPRAEHLKKLIVLAVESQAFAAGHEAEEIRALWKVARQKVLLDERWLAVVLDQRGSPHQDVEPPSAPLKSDSLENDESDKEEDSAEAPKPSVPESFDKNGHSQESSHSSAQTLLQTNTDRPQRSPFVRILIALVILPVIIFAASSSATSTVRANKTLTAQTYPSYLSGQGTLAIFDPLNQEGDDWSADKSESLGGSCQFTGGAYHVSAQNAGHSYKCYSDAIFSDFAFEVQLIITQGDCGGVIFRDDLSKGFYTFSICQSGMYHIRKRANLSDSTLMRRARSSAIHAGLNQQNKIAVVASDDTMTFYVNEQQIDQVQDSSYTSGKIGLIAAPYHHEHGHVTDVAYTNAKVWIL